MVIHTVCRTKPKSSNFLFVSSEQLLLFGFCKSACSTAVFCYAKVKGSICLLVKWADTGFCLCAAIQCCDKFSNPGNQFIIGIHIWHGIYKCISVAADVPAADILISGICNPNAGSVPRQRQRRWPGTEPALGRFFRWQMNLTACRLQMVYCHLVSL